MPLMPARVKYRKMHRGSRAGLATRGHTVAFGEYGLQAMERCWLDTKQIEAARVAVTRFMKRRGKVWIRIFPANFSAGRVLSLERYAMTSSGFVLDWPINLQRWREGEQQVGRPQKHPAHTEYTCLHGGIPRYSNTLESKSTLSVDGKDHAR